MEEGGNSLANLGRIAPRDREVVSTDTRCLKIKSAESAFTGARSAAPPRPPPGTNRSDHQHPDRAQHRARIFDQITVQTEMRRYVKHRRGRVEFERNLA